MSFVAVKVARPIPAPQTGGAGSSHHFHLTLELKLIYFSIILICSETSINEEISGFLVKSVIFTAKDKRKETKADIKEINKWPLKQRFDQ